jgi:hypothetical protein
MSTYYSDDGALGLVIFGILIFVLGVGVFCGRRGGRTFMETLNQNDGVNLCRYVLQNEKTGDGSKEYQTTSQILHQQTEMNTEFAKYQTGKSVEVGQVIARENIIV